MPKRNLLLLSLLTALSLVAWLARDHARHARQIGEVLAAVERSSLEPVPADELTRAALDGIVSRLDEYSAVVDGAARREIEAALDQSFGGVGLELVGSPDGITVHVPVVGGPAWRSGVAAGDTIVAIDGADTRGMSVRDAVALLRGAVGSTVAVGIRDAADTPGIDGARAAGAERTVTLVRELVRTESVLGDRRLPDGSWEWFVEGESGIGFMRITGFGDRTPREVDAALEKIGAAPGLRGLVIDLRGNPGGLLAAAIDVCDRFLDGGVIVSTRRRGGGGGDVVETRRASSGEALAGVPIAVLIDGLTASAAEIVAACLQDHGRGVIVGSRSFGKGTVQSLIPLSDGRRLLKLTTAEYLRPAEAGIEGHRQAGSWGVDPDVGREIDLAAQTRETLAAWRLRRDVPPPAGGNMTPVSAAELPRHVDPVLALALVALPSAEPEFGGEKETAGDTDDAARPGEPAGAGDGGGG